MVRLQEKGKKRARTRIQALKQSLWAGPSGGWILGECANSP